MDKIMEFLGSIVGLIIVLFGWMIIMPVAGFIAAVFFSLFMLGWKSI